MSIRKTHGYWKVNGIVAKIAAKQKMITNKSSGGTGVRLSDLLKSCHIPQARRQNLIYHINSVCLRMSNVLSKRYPNLKELGFDVGLDENLNIYIIEINTKPKYSVYKQAGEMHMYKTIDAVHHAIIKKVKRYKREI